MNLYLIKRRPDRFISDAYAYAVVAAANGEAARCTHPAKGVVWRNTRWSKAGRDYGSETWTIPTKVQFRLIGVAPKGTKAGIICTSFN